MRTVISTGGGIVHTESAMQALRDTGIVVYVDRPLETLLSETDTSGRPLLANGKSAISALYQKRRHLYQGYADITSKNTADASACAEAIIRKLEEHLR